MKPNPYKVSVITWFRLIIGTVLMFLMGYAWLYVERFDIILFAIPAALMGIHPLDTITRPRRPPHE